MLYGWSLWALPQWSEAKSLKISNFSVFLSFDNFFWSSSSLKNFFSKISLWWFFGLVFWVGFSGGNFEGANLTRLDSIFSGSFFFSLWWWLKKNIISSYSVFSISHAIDEMLFIAIHIPRRKGDFTGDWLFQTPASKSRTLILPKIFWYN